MCSNLAKMKMKCVICALFLVTICKAFDIRRTPDRMGVIDIPNQDDDASQRPGLGFPRFRKNPPRGSPMFPVPPDSSMFRVRLSRDKVTTPVPTKVVELDSKPEAAENTDVKPDTITIIKNISKEVDSKEKLDSLEVVADIKHAIRDILDLKGEMKETFKEMVDDLPKPDDKKSEEESEESSESKESKEDMVKIPLDKLDDVKDDMDDLFKLPSKDEKDEDSPLDKIDEIKDDLIKLPIKDEEDDKDVWKPTLEDTDDIKKVISDKLPMKEDDYEDEVKDIFEKPDLKDLDDLIKIPDDKDKEMDKIDDLKEDLKDLKMPKDDDEVKDKLEDLKDIADDLKKKDEEDKLKDLVKLPIKDDDKEKSDDIKDIIDDLKPPMKDIDKPILEKPDEKDEDFKEIITEIIKTPSTWEDGKDILDSFIDKLEETKDNMTDPVKDVSKEEKGLKDLLAEFIKPEIAQGMKRVVTEIIKEGLMDDVKEDFKRILSSMTKEEMKADLKQFLTDVLIGPMMDDIKKDLKRGSGGVTPLKPTISPPREMPTVPKTPPEEANNDDDGIHTGEESRLVPTQIEVNTKTESDGSQVGDDVVTFIKRGIPSGAKEPGSWRKRREGGWSSHNHGDSKWSPHYGWSGSHHGHGFSHGGYRGGGRGNWNREKRQTKLRRQSGRIFQD